MFSEQLLRHFREPRHVGLLPAPACSVFVENPVCGDQLQLSATLADGVIQSVGFQARGCTAAIAAGSAVATLLEARTLEEARSVNAAAVEAELGGLESASKHAARLAADAVTQLLRSLETR
jgi:nitrogen fixation NifU-like protein